MDGKLAFDGDFTSLLHDKIEDTCNREEFKLEIVYSLGGSVKIIIVPEYSRVLIPSNEIINLGYDESVKGTQLRIIAAFYGKEESEEFVNVTNEIRKHVIDDCLLLDGNFNEVCGDPYPNFPKVLDIVYCYDSGHANIARRYESNPIVLNQLNQLFILEARYFKNDDPDKFIDVVDILRNFVVNNSLSLDGDFNAMFGDPFLECPKTLEVMYKIGNQAAVTVKLNEYCSAVIHNQSHGLNIVNAFYCCDEDPQLNVNVTDMVRGFVYDNSLSLDGDFNEMFGDILPDASKYLKVCYTYNDEPLKYVQFQEFEPVEIPEILYEISPIEFQVMKSWVLAEFNGVSDHRVTAIQNVYPTRDSILKINFSNQEEITPFVEVFNYIRGFDTLWRCLPRKRNWMIETVILNRSDVQNWRGFPDGTVVKRDDLLHEERLNYGLILFHDESFSWKFVIEGNHRLSLWFLDQTVNNTMITCYVCKGTMPKWYYGGATFRSINEN